MIDDQRTAMRSVAWVTAALMTICALSIAGCGQSDQAARESPRRPASTAGPAASTISPTCRIEHAAAQQAGTLPPAGATEVDGVALPPGSVKSPDSSMLQQGVRPGPALWVSDAPVAPAVWIEFAQRFARTGLWPLLVDDLDTPDREERRRPWDSGEFQPGDVTRVDQFDPEDWMSKTSADWDADAVGASPFDGLAAAATSCRQRIEDAMRNAPSTSRLALVPVRRPADALTEIGWLGPTNYYGDMAPFSAVLRSWDDRFGAVPVSLGFDTMIVIFQGLPPNAEERERLALEIDALCPDLVDQGEGTTHDLADALNKDGGLQFWWD